MAFMWLLFEVRDIREYFKSRHKWIVWHLFQISISEIIFFNAFSLLGSRGFLISAESSADNSYFFFGWNLEAKNKFLIAS